VRSPRSEIVGGLEFLQLYLVDMVRGLLLVRQVAGPHQREDDGEEDQAVEEPEHHHEEEHLEEDDEGIVVGGGQQHHGQQRGQTPVEHGRAHL